MKLYISLIKHIGFGAFFGSFYCFVSFYLLYSSFDKNIYPIILYGIQGSIFGFLFFLINKILYICFNCKRYLFSIISGVVSGLFSGFLNIGLTINALIINQNNLTNSINMSIYFQIFYYALGCFAMGGMIGFIIERTRE